MTGVKSTGPVQPAGKPSGPEKLETIDINSITGAAKLKAYIRLIGSMDSKKADEAMDKLLNQIIKAVESGSTKIQIPGGVKVVPEDLNR